jgi:CBS domain containing-hemolysin-like protein
MILLIIITQMVFTAFLLFWLGLLSWSVVMLLLFTPFFFLFLTVLIFLIDRIPLRIFRCISNSSTYVVYYSDSSCIFGSRIVNLFSNRYFAWWLTKFGDNDDLKLRKTPEATYMGYVGGRQGHIC